MSAPRSQGVKEEDRRRGVVLLTALGFVAVMAAASVAVTETVFVGVRRAAVTQSTAQARWLALGAEAFAMETIGAALQARDGTVSLDDPWSAPTVFPAPGGFIEGRIRDISNCFNLNDILDDAPADEEVSVPERMFLSLSAALEIDRGAARRLMTAVRDWIDADGTPSGAGGREDFDYAVLNPPYRTGGVPLAHVSELRAVDGVTPILYARLRPYLCVRPPGAPTMINVNTLGTEDGAPLLRMVFGPELTQRAADAVLRSRPLGGWRTADAFLARPEIAELDVAEALRARIAVTSRFFEADVRVRTDDAFLAMTSAFTVQSGGRTTLLARAFGTPQ